MKNTKARENETMSKFNDFVSKLNKKKAADPSTTSKEQAWMQKPLQFQVTSDKAYNV